MAARHSWRTIFAAQLLGSLLLLSPARGEALRQIRVQPDKAPDCTSLEAIVESITRDCKTNDERAVAIYNFCQLTNYHRAYPSEPGGVPSLKVINCYGWSLCGGLHSIESALWKAAGWEHRFVGWNGHTTVEAKYDGRWHYLDIFLKFYAWAPDGKGGRTIASQDDLVARGDELVKNAFRLDSGRGCVYAKDNQFAMIGEHANWRAPALLSCGDTIADVIGGLKTHHNAGAETSWAGINHATGKYSTDLDLVAGAALTNTWDAAENAWYWADQKEAPGHTCSGFKDNRNDPAYGLILEPYINASRARSYGTGVLTFAPDFSDDKALASFAKVDNVKVADGRLVPVDASKPASVVLKLQSPYILTKASGAADGADSVDVSIDAGKTFAPADLKDFTRAVKGQMAALVRISFKKALKDLKIEALVQNNPGSLPYLSPGKNTISVSVADPADLGENKLVVTYAYRLGSRSKSFDQLCEEGKEIARQHNAKWSNTISYVQKTFTARQLPAKFEIDCPTPRGQHPVYPRMVMLRREVISPSAKPQALPADSAPAIAKSGDELATLPNPFLIGSEAPTPVKRRAVATTRLPLKFIHFSNDKGEVADAGQLAWPKNSMEQGKVIAGAVLLGGDLSGVSNKKLSAARVLVPVVQGHNSANGKLGAVLLKTAIKPGEPCDFKALDSIAGTTVIPRQPAGEPQYKPAKPFAIDVTGGLKQLLSAGADKFQGIALRIVPDRGVDDGYTVRCQVAPKEPFVLELDYLQDDATKTSAK